MAFWKENKADPVRKFRFTVDGDGIWWWIKSINKPSFEINSNEYLLINHKFKYPGVLTWNDVTLTIVDPGGKAKEINGYLTKHGYSDPSTNKTGIQKNGFNGEGRNIIIQQLNSEGVIIERWELHNSFIKSVQYGDLAYADDELVEIQMVISYDYATFSEEATTT